MLRIFFALFLTCVLNASAMTFTVGVENVDYYPHYAVRHGEYVGYARDLLDKFAAINGYKFKYVILPIRRLSVAFLRDHAIDFKFPDNSNWAPQFRANQPVIYSLSVIDVVEGAMVLPQRKARDLSEVKVLGTILGFTPLPYLDQIKRGSIKLSENANFVGLIQQVLLGRVDAAYIDVAVGEEILMEMRRPGALVYDPSLPRSSSKFTLSTLEHADIIRQFNKFLYQEKNFQIRLCEKYQMKCRWKPSTSGKKANRLHNR